jgi:hypothetical protein
MATANEIYELTLGLIDEEAGDEAYERRVLPLLKVIRSEIAGELGVRGGLPELDGFDDEVGLPDDVCESVAPYGLAAHLLLEEDPARASYFEVKYEEELARARKRVAMDFGVIENVYGGIEFGEFSKW